MDRITTTIKREFLAEIVRGDKKIEYRELKAYWTNKLTEVSTPFELHLINGTQTISSRLWTRGADAPADPTRMGQGNRDRPGFRESSRR